MYGDDQKELDINVANREKFRARSARKPFYASFLHVVSCHTMSVIIDTVDAYDRGPSQTALCPFQPIYGSSP